MSGHPPAATVVALLRWYLEAGVDEAVSEQPVNRLLGEAAPPRSATGSATATPAPAQAATPDSAQVAKPVAGQGGAPHHVPPPAAAPMSLVRAAPPVAAEPVADAVERARAAGDLAQLRAALESFDACPLRRTATRLVFGRGSPNALVVLIGEAPGAEEDRQGLPFVGPSGRLLDRMLASIGLDEERVFISNTVFWRPPGNRSPTPAEAAVCMPFVQRLIELIAPRFLVALGGPAANALFAQADSVGRLRGRWFDYPLAHAQPVAATALFHPAYLLRSPAQKRLAWRDLLAIKARIDAIGLT